jgi:hypothetical protein
MKEVITILQKDIPITMTGAVVNQGTDFSITLTDQNMDFNEFQKSYITLHITMDLTFDGGFPLSQFTKTVGPPQNWSNKWSYFGQLTTGEARKTTVHVFGFKHATDCISQLTVRQNGLNIETSIQDKYPMVSYLVNVVNPHMKKDQKRDTFTLLENAHSHNPSICGVYLSYWDLYTKYRTSGGQNKYTISFQVVFNYDDLLPFLGFDQFPNSIFGQFSLTTRITTEALHHVPG